MKVVKVKFFKTFLVASFYLTFLKRNIGLKCGPFSKRIIKRGVVTVASTEVWANFPKNKNKKTIFIIKNTGKY